MTTEADSLEDNSLEARLSMSKTLDEGAKIYFDSNPDLQTVEYLGDSFELIRILRNWTRNISS